MKRGTIPVSSEQNQCVPGIFPTPTLHLYSDKLKETLP